MNKQLEMYRKYCLVRGLDRDVADIDVAIETNDQDALSYFNYMASILKVDWEVLAKHFPERAHLI